MLRTLIIDDEANIRAMIREIVDGYCDDAVVVGQAGSVKEGIARINELHPDLVLLDIKMDDGTGFDILEALGRVEFKIVFITAYQEYALKAIKFSAMDYIMKPVDPEELVNAIGRIAREVFPPDEKQLIHLKENLKTHDQSGKKILLKTTDSIHVLRFSDILFCEAEGSYTSFYTNSGNRVIVSSSLSAYDELLTEYGFFRAHKSFLVNLEKIVRFEREEGGYIVLDENHRIPVASRKKDQLIQLLEKLTE